VPRIHDIRRPIRVVLADDQPMIRRVVRTQLESTSRFRVCGEARTGEEAVHASNEWDPDVVILNLAMPEMNGFEAARLIRSKPSRSAIVILSPHKNHQFVAEAQRIGVQGFVAKEDAAAELVGVIENAEIGDTFTVAELRTNEERAKSNGQSHKPDIFAREVNHGFSQTGSNP
jgi:two-component system, NarL family, nitrate/nitrite response regulator NarL